MAIQTLLELPEPVLILNGMLVHSPAPGTTQLARAAGELATYPDEFGPTLAYFTKLRTESEAVADGPVVGFDAADLTALVATGVLWRCAPASTDELKRRLGALGVLVVAPPAPVQNREGYLCLALGDRQVTLLSTVGAEILEAAAGDPVGPVVAQLAARHAADPDVLWRYLAADLAGLLATGAAVVVIGGA